jgi:hypothetical protein
MASLFSKSRKRYPLIIVFLLAVLFFVKHSYADVQDQFNLFISQEDFSGCIAYLNNVKINAEKDKLFEVEYRLALAKSLYLDYLESKQDWEGYYDKVDQYNQDIIDIAYKYAGRDITPELIDLQRLAQKAYLRDDDEDAAQEVFDNFVSNIITYTQKTGDIAKFKEIAKLIAQEGHKRYVDQLFIAYKKYLSDTNAPLSDAMRLLEIADEYLNDGQVEMAIVIYSHYVDFAIANYSQSEAKSAMLVICDKFREYGFAPALNADFAEKIYVKLEKNYGRDVFDEQQIFERALNLEALGDFEAAQQEYGYFIERFTQSPYLPEAYCRLGIINIFYLKQKKQGENYLSRIVEIFPESDYKDFAAYYTGLLKQLQGDDNNALVFYNKVSDKARLFFELAQARKDEINDGKPLAEELAYPLDLIFNQDGSSVIMTLEGFPSITFIDQNVTWKGTAQDFSVGTVQPFFKYQWFWDTGSNQNPGSTTQFETSYDAALPHLVCFSAQSAGAENAICRVLWVHDIKIERSQQAKVGQPVEFSVKISPLAMQEKDMRFSWKVKTGTPVTANEKDFSHVFEKAGKYEAELNVSVQNKKFKKKFSFSVAE